MPLPTDLRLNFENDPSTEDRNFLDRSLDLMNVERWPMPQPGNFAVFLRNAAGEIEAGLDAVHYGGWLFVHNLWITEARRSQGLGRLLMTQAEERARTLGCHSAWLDTFSFQAPGFYQKLGYEIFGTLDHPPGAKRHFLRKSLGQ
jgi:GNAT superfamily N-acetyltransferase